jgi:penicillin-binding protein 2
LARAIGGIAMGGQWRQPHLVRSPEWKDKPVEWSLDPANVKDVVDGMCGVVNEAGATGVRAALPGIEVCGKTGTAQVASEDYVKAHKGDSQNLKDNAWFVGFAPGRAPEIVVAALFEHGAESKFAAPIVRDVIKAYFDKKTRLTLLKQQQDGLAGKMALEQGPAQGPGARGQGPAQGPGARGQGPGNFVPWIIAAAIGNIGPSHPAQSAADGLSPAPTRRDGGYPARPPAPVYGPRPPAPGY